MLPIIDLLYPRHCPVCQDIVNAALQDAYICENCKRELPYLQGPRCMKCGKEVDREEQEYCRDCVRLPKHYIQGYPVFRYEGALKAGMAAFKYHNRKEYAEFYADSIWQTYKQELQQCRLDLLIPVPVHKHKLRKRGYNQAELIARALSRYMQLPCCGKVLTRIIDTRPQKELNDKERLNNLKRAFLLSSNEVKLKRVLLVDDIYTTGATIEACTQVLSEAGAEAVYYTSVCIGEGFGSSL